MICPLCRQRKAKRACPGLGHDICAVCCGTKRIVEIACPATCIYLEHAHRYPAASVRRQQESDLTVLMAALGRVSEPQLELFFLIQASILKFLATARAQSGATVTDADVAEAAGAIAATFETAARGVVYEHSAQSTVAESLRRELMTVLNEIRRGGGSRFEREAADVLRGIERGAAHATLPAGAGPLDYLSLVARVLQSPPPAAAATSSIILP
jgi:hypothetical protein